MTGQTTLVELRAMRSISGSNQPSFISFTLFKTSLDTSTAPVTWASTEQITNNNTVAWIDDLNRP